MQTSISLHPAPRLRDDAACRSGPLWMQGRLVWRDVRRKRHLSASSSLACERHLSASSSRNSLSSEARKEYPGSIRDVSAERQHPRPPLPVLTGVSSRFAKRIRRAGGTMKGQRTPGRCESSGNPAGEVRVRGSADLARRGSSIHFLPTLAHQPLVPTHFLQKPSTPLIHPLHTFPHNLSHRPCGRPGAHRVSGKGVGAGLVA